METSFINGNFGKAKFSVQMDCLRAFAIGNDEDLFYPLLFCVADAGLKTGASGTGPCVHSFCRELHDFPIPVFPGGNHAASHDGALAVEREKYLPARLM